MRLEAAEAEAASLRAELGAARREGGTREAAGLREEEARRAAEAEAAQLSAELRAAMVRAAAAEEEGAAAAELMEARRAAAEARRRREEDEVRLKAATACIRGCSPNVCPRLRPIFPRLRRHVSEACRPMYQVREAREDEGEGMRRLEGHVQRLTEQCEIESAVRCDMHPSMQVVTI